jgi:phosphoribosylformylglycinamidine synthase subunit PurQ / glutaminase
MGRLGVEGTFTCSGTGELRPIFDSPLHRAPDSYAMAVRFAVIVFPGSNCDHDAYHAAKHVMGQEARFVWHKEAELGEADVVIVPGGFSYGDYLRAGAVARFSPVMQDVVRFANDGGLVIGICNGFQVLCEAGLLPGALMRNESLRFGCKDTFLRVENASTPFSHRTHQGQVLRIPVAHGEGNYVADEETLDRLEANGQVVFRYCDARGNVTPESNPNGSVRNIAGIVNEQRNVLGMMPHPERCVELLLARAGGSDHGRLVFESIIEHLGAEVPA